MKVFKWHPHAEIQRDLSVMGFRYEGQALVIVFRDPVSFAYCRMTFQSPLAFRCTDELNLCAYYNPRDFPGSQFHIVEDSVFLAWFRQSSGCETLSDKVVHYVILTWDDCFDIIAMEPPLVLWQPQNSRENLAPPPWSNPM